MFILLNNKISVNETSLQLGIAFPLASERPVLEEVVLVVPVGLVEVELLDEVPEYVPEEMVAAERRAKTLPLVY